MVLFLRFQWDRNDILPLVSSKHMTRLALKRAKFRWSFSIFEGFLFGNVMSTHTFTLIAPWLQCATIYINTTPTDQVIEFCCANSHSPSEHKLAVLDFEQGFVPVLKVMEYEQGCLGLFSSGENNVTWHWRCFPCFKDDSMLEIDWSLVCLSSTW